MTGNEHLVDEEMLIDFASDECFSISAMLVLASTATVPDKNVIHVQQETQERMDKYPHRNTEIVLIVSFDLMQGVLVTGS